MILPPETLIRRNLGRKKKKLMGHPRVSLSFFLFLFLFLFGGLPSARSSWTGRTGGKGVVVMALEFQFRS